MLLLFYKGLVIGLAIGAPVGPVGALSVRQTLQRGRTVGIAAGFGAALADSVFGAVAAFGLSQVFAYVADHQTEIRVIGVVAMIALAIRMFTSKKPAVLKGGKRPQFHRGGAVAQATASGFLLTITNPMLILAFLAFFAAAGIFQTDLTPGQGGVLVAGVFAGAMIWWTALTLLTGLFKNRIDPENLIWVSRATAILLLICAGLVATSLIAPDLVPFMQPKAT